MTPYTYQPDSIEQEEARRRRDQWFRVFGMEELIGENDG